MEQLNIDLKTKEELNISDYYELRFYALTNEAKHSKKKFIAYMEHHNEVKALELSEIVEEDVEDKSLEENAILAICTFIQLLLKEKIKELLSLVAIVLVVFLFYVLLDLKTAFQPNVSIGIIGGISMALYNCFVLITELITPAQTMVLSAMIEIDNFFAEYFPELYRLFENLSKH